MSGCVDVYATVGEGRPEETRPVDVALREMDAGGVEIAWIRPPDAYVAVRNREGNDFVTKTVAENPNRFVGCAVANPWFGEKAIEELGRAFGDGLGVLVLCPPVQGFQLSDPLVHPLVEAAIQWNAPIYAHTGTPVCAEPLQLAALASRYPEGKFIMGHMGYADFWYDVASAGEAHNIWFETSRIDCDIISNSVKGLGAGRFLFGSDAPRCSLAVELEKIIALPFAKGDIHSILRENARQLLA